MDHIVRSLEVLSRLWVLKYLLLFEFFVLVFISFYLLLYCFSNLASFGQYFNCVLITSSFEPEKVTGFCFFELMYLGQKTLPQ